jgi:hypothetical protein
LISNLMEGNPRRGDTLCQPALYRGRYVSHLVSLLARSLHG